MKNNTPGPIKVGAEGEEIEAADGLYILPLSQNGNTTDHARLGYLGRLADHQAREAERFDDMCLASERYRADPTPANAVKAHLAARRYEAAA